MIEMFEGLIDRNLKITVSSNYTKEIRQYYGSAIAAVPGVYNGVLTGYFANGENYFIVLNENLYISLKYIQTIEVIN
jgi:hypothetical protein